MKLKWKYFIVLLVFSLVPLTVASFINYTTSKDLGESISSQTTLALSATVRREIVSATENYAMITGRSKLSSELALHLLISEAEKALALPPPPSTTVYFAEDFDNPASAPSDLAPSRHHMMITENGTIGPKQISTRHPNFFIPSAVDRTALDGDIARMAGLSAALKGIAEAFGDKLFWIYASLESGVHISYPGHGGYPEGYDPRQRPWYTQARSIDDGGVRWGEPIADATTNQLTFTVSGPISKPDGSFAGVAAIDVLLPQVLLQNRVSSQWSEKMRPFLVGAAQHLGTFWVLSQQQDAEPAGGSRDAMIRIEEDPDFIKLVPLFADEKVGNLEMPYQGIDSFWAYAEIFPGLYFVIIAPKSLVMELPREVGNSFSHYWREQRNISITVVALVVMAVAISALLISRTNTRTILSIVQGFEKMEKGDFSARLQVTFNDERDQIVSSYNRIMPTLDEHLKMSRALGVAHQVQQSLLPDKNPTLPGFDIAGRSVYCDETGGDYYDFLWINDDRLAVVVGDVSGHGVSSALLMATARALVMLRSSMPGPAAAIINDVNRHLSLDTSETGNFMTFFYCELSERSRQIRWVRAGHDPAIIYDPHSGEFNELKGRGPALGLDYSFEYEESQRKLDKHQIILIGTDGIWEMRNQEGEMFGKERLKLVLRTQSSAPAGDILAAVEDALWEFRGAAPLEDDVTMVVIKIEQEQRL